MKYIILMSALTLSACATTGAPPPEPLTPTTQAPAATPAPAVDCTGLSEAECQHQIKHYGNPNPPPMRGPYDLDPVPVEPVDVEPLGDING